MLAATRSADVAFGPCTDAVTTGSFACATKVSLYLVFLAVNWLPRAGDGVTPLMARPTPLYGPCAGISVAGMPSFAAIGSSTAWLVITCAKTDARVVSGTVSWDRLASAESGESTR